MQCTAQQTYGTRPPKGGIVARWDFGSAAQGFVREQISGSRDPIVGISRPTISPVGSALQMDGYTTVIRQPSLGGLAHASDLSISCWLQLEAYPWNEVPILDQDGPDRAGCFGVDAEGHLIASLTAKTEIHKFTSGKALPLRQWTLVTFTAASDGKVALYIGGQSTVAEEAVTPIASGSEPASNQESDILVGETPEDNINFDALRFANLQGDAHTYSWQPKTDKGLSVPKGPEHFTEPANAVIQWVNLNSTWKPFQVASGEPVKFDAYNDEQSISAFELWNHWPVAQIASSGRPPLAADRPGHTSLSHIYWPVSEQDDQHIERILMDGLTTLEAAQLAPLAASWLTPAPADVTGGASIRYDAAQRAYVLPGAMPETLNITLHGSKQSPVVNPAFVFPEWQGKASVSVKSGPLTTPVEVTLGYVEELEQVKLIAFVPITSEHDVTITIHSEK